MIFYFPPQNANDAKIPRTIRKVVSIELRPYKYTYRKCQIMTIDAIDGFGGNFFSVVGEASPWLQPLRHSGHRAGIFSRLSRTLSPRGAPLRPPFTPPTRPNSIIASNCHACVGGHLLFSLNNLYYPLKIEFLLLFST